MYLIIIIFIYTFIHLINRRQILENDIFPMGMQLMEINVTFSKKLNLLHNPDSKIKIKKKDQIQIELRNSLKLKLNLPIHDWIENLEVI